jgi:predicted nucleic acid-binding protein
MTAGEERQFVDTNILVYSYDKGDGEKQKLAKDLIASLWESRKGCISIQVLQELYVTMTRKATTPLAPDAAASIIADLSTWPHHVPAAGDILQAADIQQRYGISFWDAMIVNSACKTGCSILWTEDLNSGQVYESVTARNPFLIHLRPRRNTVDA